MEIQVLWRVISQRWRVVAIVTLLAIVLALAWFLAGPVSYKATGRVIISTSGSLGTAGDAYSSEQVSISRAPTYAELLKGPEVAARASKKLNGDISAQSIQDSIDARITSRLPMVIVTATSRSANDAVQIVAAAEQGLQEYVKEMERPGRDGSLTSVSLSGDAPVVTRDSNPIRNAILAGLAGLVVGCMLAVYRDRTDPRVKSAGQVAGEGFAYRGTVKADQEERARTDAFRRIAVSVFVSADTTPGRLLVVGVDPECDASFVARGLGRGLALCGRAVTVIDCADTSRADTARGLTDVLATAVDWREYAVPTDIESLHAMGVGTKSGALDALLIDLNDPVRRLALSDAHEHMIIAGPSIVHSSVAVALTAVVDAALVVVRKGESDIADLTEARLTLDAMGIPVVGLLLIDGVASPSDDRSQSATKSRIPSDGDTAVTPAVQQDSKANGVSQGDRRQRSDAQQMARTESDGDSRISHGTR